jgi:hypothetical protein
LSRPAAAVEGDAGALLGPRQGSTVDGVQALTALLSLVAPERPEEIKLGDLFEPSSQLPQPFLILLPFGVGEFADPLSLAVSASKSSQRLTNSA